MIGEPSCDVCGDQSDPLTLTVLSCDYCEGYDQLCPKCHELYSRNKHDTYMCVFCDEWLPLTDEEMAEKGGES